MKTPLLLHTLTVLTLVFAAHLPDASAQAPIVFHTQRYNGPANGHDRANALVLDAQGNRIVTGESTNGSNNDYYTAKYSVADDALLWEHRYSATGSSGDRATAVAVDPAGHVLVTGESSISGFDFYTAKYHRDTGAILWEQRYNGGSTDTATEIAVDASGNVAVTGVSNPVGSSFADFFTIKYAGTDGAVLWSQRFNGTGNRGDTPAALAMDAAGNVFVTGSSAASTTNSEMYKVKYDSLTGAIAWSKRYDFAPTTADQGIGLALDSLGNVIVTGASASDVITIKYAALDGALLWDRRYDNGGIDVGRTVGVDAADDVFVAGYAANASTDDFYTAKYAGNDGAVRWERLFHRAGNSEDRAVALALDELGNVVVTGSTNNPTVFNDNYLTLKYAGADGTLLWNVSYNGPVGGSQDIPTALALERAGGGIVVAGRSSAASAGSNFDYAIVKYVDGPAPETLAATAIAANGAILNGSIRPNTYACNASFEVSLNADLTGASVTPSTAISAGQVNPVPISENLTALLAGATYYFRARVTGNTYTYFGPILSFTTLDPDTDDDGLLDAWELTYWPTTVGHAALDDFDGDGLVELLEMAFGLNPTLSDAATAPQPIDEAGYLTLTITKQPGVTYLVQTAATLDTASWTATDTTVLLDNVTTLKVRDNFPIGTVPVRYLRVNVTAL